MRVMTRCYISFMIIAFRMIVRCSNVEYIGNTKEALSTSSLVSEEQSSGSCIKSSAVDKHEPEEPKSNVCTIKEEIQHHAAESTNSCVDSNMDIYPIMSSTVSILYAYKHRDLKEYKILRKMRKKSILNNIIHNIEQRIQLSKINEDIYKKANSILCHNKRLNNINNPHLNTIYFQRDLNQRFNRKLVSPFESKLKYSFCSCNKFYQLMSNNNELNQYEALKTLPLDNSNRITTNIIRKKRKCKKYED